MVLKFSKFLENQKHELELHYYAFDWDDNILHMDTVIHMDKLVDGEWVPTDVSTSDFAKVRGDKSNYRLRNNNPDEAFSEFRDTGPRGDSAFLQDVKSSISKRQFGPAWDSFKKCLSEGSIFSIITARGHEPKTLRLGVEYIIDNVLTEEETFLLYSNCLKHAYLFSYDGEFDRIPKGVLSKTPLISLYLDECYFWGVSSESFKEEFGAGSAQDPEKAKELALDKFVEKCNDLGRKVGAKSVSIGFSDDDPKNVDHVRSYFKEKSALTNELMPHDVKLSLYKTTDRSKKGGERSRYISGKEEVFEAAGSSIAPGMGSSVMAFSQFNNMSDRMFTNNQEYDKSMRLGSNQLAKMSKEIIKAKKKKLKK